LKLDSESPPARVAQAVGDCKPTNELAAAIQDEVAPGENGRMSPNAAGL